MGIANHSESLIRFGEFELDFSTHELFRNNARLKVRGHPVDILAILLEHPGELVTRETLRKRLWPDDTFVDFEQILNNSVGKLRDALGDRAESPQFIETLPRLGYRFIAPLQNCASLAQAPQLALVAPDDSRPTESKDQNAPSQWRRIRSFAGLAFLLLLAITTTVYVAHRYYTRTTPTIHRIAVLPLVNTSIDPQEDYFADGMTDRLITELAQFSAWEVISRTSVMRYKGSNKSLPQIAHELSADRIIEGSVQRSGSRVRITAQLIDATKDVHLWSGSFERDMTDVLALQGEIAQAVADRADLTLTPQEKARLQSPHKVVPEAYDAFLTGKYLFEIRKFDDAADYFEKATIADPNFALAYAYLAEADGMWNYVVENPVSERTLNAGRRAMELDPNLAESRIVAGDRIFFREWNWEPGEAEFRRAFELDPHSESAAIHLGLCLDALRKWDESLAVYRAALRVDPFSRLLQFNLLSALLHAHKYEELAVQFKKATEVAPDAPELYGILGRMYEDMKRDKDAREAYLKADRLSGVRAERLKSLRHAFEIGGLRGYWRKRLEFRLQDDSGKPLRPYGLAVLYVHAGEDDRAIDLLEEAYRLRRPNMAWMNSVIDFAPLQNKPSYKDLMRRMNFPPPPAK